MTKELRHLLLAALVITIAIAILVPLVVPRLATLLSSPEESRHRIGVGVNTVKGEILEIVEEGTVMLGEITQPYQILRVEVLDGSWEGQVFEIDYGKRQIRPEGLTLRPGDRLLINIDQPPDGSLKAFFIDFVRTGPLLLLFITFVLFGILVGGKQGARGLLGLLISLVVILTYIIPNILHGRDPIIVSILGALLILGVTLYLIYGWSLKTHAALLGLLITLVFTGLTINFFINLTRLTGFGNEDALFVLQQSDITINLRGLVLAGMLIGALGALDDLVITQASVVFELHTANPEFRLLKLYKSAMRVGQDHVSAMINTLFMAYTGAALPTLLLFSLSRQAFVDLINLEFVAEDVVRTLAGSLGLIAAAPISTAIASLTVSYKHHLTGLGRFLGSQDINDDHSHILDT